MNTPSTLSSVFLTLCLAAWGSTAEAGEGLAMSELIEDGWSTVILVHTGEVECVTFEVDAQGNRRSTYETWSSIKEVYSYGENGTEEEFALGESIPVRWYDSVRNPYIQEEAIGCGGGPGADLRSGQDRMLALNWYEGAWFLDSDAWDDLGLSTDSQAEAPPCGEDVQQQVIEDLQDDAPAEEGWGHHLDDGGADGEGAGCSVLPLSQAGFMATLLGVLGLSRRREG